MNPHAREPRGKGATMPKIRMSEDDALLCQELAHLLELNGYESCACDDFAHAAE